MRQNLFPFTERLQEEQELGGRAQSSQMRRKSWGAASVLGTKRELIFGMEMKRTCIDRKQSDAYRQ